MRWSLPPQMLQELHVRRIARLPADAVERGAGAGAADVRVLGLVLALLGGVAPEIVPEPFLLRVGAAGGEGVDEEEAQGEALERGLRAALVGDLAERGQRLSEELLAQL